MKAINKGFATVLDIYSGSNIDLLDMNNIKNTTKIKDNFMRQNKSKRIL